MKNYVRWKVFLLVMLALGFAGSGAWADDSANIAELTAMNEALQNNLNIVWTCLAAFLVFFMQAGFAMVEVGFTRAKNAVNIIMKNLMDFSIGTLAFFFIGFGLMFGVTNGVFGTTDFCVTNLLSVGDTAGDGAHWNYTFLIFQTVFAGTAATIVSGAMAGRTKFKAYLLYRCIYLCVHLPRFSGHGRGAACSTVTAGWKRWVFVISPVRLLYILSAAG